MTYPYCGTFRISIQSMLSDKDSDKKQRIKHQVKKKACEMRRNQKEKIDFKRIILRFMLFLQKALKKYSYGL